MVAVVCPLATEMVAGEIATEKSAGAAPTLVTNPSARPPPNEDCNADGDTGNPVVLSVDPANRRYSQNQLPRHLRGRGLYSHSRCSHYPCRRENLSRPETRYCSIRSQKHLKYRLGLTETGPHSSDSRKTKFCP